MRMGNSVNRSAAALCALFLTACSASSAAGRGPLAVPTTVPATVAATGTSGLGAGAAPVSVVDFDLYTHCGIREARVGSTYYDATPVLDDGNGNPPPGWGNAFQHGRMSLYADGSAVFTDDAGHVARFTARHGATAFETICS
jgi:hypothetical protein